VRAVNPQLYTLPVPDPAPADIDSLIGLLSAEERARAQRYQHDADRRSYVAAHLLLRRRLGRLTGREDWNYTTNRYGRPELAPPCGDPPLRFNLSHTAGLVACGISLGVDIGVDVEWIDQATPVEGLANRFFAEAECRQLAQAAPERRRAMFFDLWTLKEAITKALGCGLALSLKDFAVTLDPLGVRFDSQPDGREGDWTLFLRRFPYHRVALAVRRPDAIVAWQCVEAFW
jgi:4'-phosphopantetheinyl transferase